MVTLLGTAPQFDGNTADWEVYTEQLSHFFTANKISSEDQKRSVLMTVCGSATYKLMRSLAAPTDVASLKYADLVKLVQDHYNPAPSVIVMRFKFNSCVRLSGESISAYVAWLQDLAHYCVYGATLDDMLRCTNSCRSTKGGGKEQQEAFQNSKSRLTESSLLVHYDPHRELLLSCDASPYGVGAVLSHKMEDGTE